MATMRLILTLLVLLWGATALAEEHGDAGSGAAAEGGAQDDAGAGAEEDAGDAAGGEEDADAEGEVGAAAEGQEGAAAEGEVVGGGEAAAVEPWTFPAFDTDGNGFLAQEEFSVGLSHLVAGEQGLDQVGFDEAVQTFGLGEEMTDFESADVNQDQMIAGTEEFGPAIAENLFSKWDKDGDSQLSATEFSSNMFSTFDVNGDGIIDTEEFQPLAGWIDQSIEGVAGGGAGIAEAFFLAEAEPYDEEAAEPAVPGEEGDAGGGGAAEPNAEGDAMDGGEEEAEDSEAGGADDAGEGGDN